MAKSRRKVPACVHHKPSGQARVRINGEDIYLGKWGSPQAEEKYRRTVAEYLQNGLTPQKDASVQSNEPATISVNELILAFWKHAKQHYVKSGKPTAEQHCFKSALRHLKDLYGSIAVSEFGPLKLKAVRQQMIDKGWTRGYVNKSVGRIRLMFRWGVENEIVRPDTLQALEAVAGLKSGRTEAPDNAPRRPVSDEHVEAVKRAVRQRTRDLIDLQLLL